MKSEKIIGAVNCVTKKWAKQRKREERRESASINRRYAMLVSHRTTTKDAAWEIMEQAYMKASAGGNLPAMARQIMYAARPYIQEQTDAPLNDHYFTQTLLPDYINETGVHWNVVFDARGHLYEPHTDFEVPLGTLEVRQYLSRVKEHKVEGSSFDVRESIFPTYGPNNRYSAILFIEKEGFMPLFNAVNLEERYDISVMSTKGLSNTASRELVDVLCGNHSIPLLVVHDFDKSGFSIVGTLKRTTRRYSFRNQIEVIDLGLRFEDIGGLESEEVSYGNTSISAVRLNLLKNGATDEEVEFLLKRRVELNAFASDEFIDWIEKKLDGVGIKKLVPDDEVLADAYRRASEQAAIQKMINEAIEEFRDQEHEVKVPDDLRQQIEAGLERDRERPWCDVLREIAEEDVE